MKNIMFKILIGVVALALQINAKDQKQDHCTALAMSGGAVKGAYEAGALWGLYYADSTKSKFRYDVVTGVSAGAINGGAVGLFKVGDEENMVNTLSMKWQQMTTSQLYKRWWPFGIFTGVSKHSGLLDTSPLYKFIDDFIKEEGGEYHRKIALAAVDAITGEYLIFDEKTKDKAKAILSSASIPFVFPSQSWNIDGREIVAIDGGVAWGTNMVSAIERCKEIVDDESKITIDIIRCDGKKLPDQKNSWSALSTYLRYDDIKKYNDGVADVSEFMMAYPNVTFRYYVAPSDDLASGLNLLNADNSTSTWPMQLTGRTDGENAVKQGEGYVFQKMREWMNNKDNVQKEFPQISTFIDRVINDVSNKFENKKKIPTQEYKEFLQN